MTDYQFSMFERLEPRTPFQGGRITDTDILTLTEAAKFASVHAGSEITPADFLRAAGRGEITLRAIVHQTAKLQKIGGGVYCNEKQSNENTVPKRSIPNLPLSACTQLAATGRASWRTFDGFEQIEGILMRYTVAELLPDEPDFETVTDDCRVTGNHVHALADAFIESPEPEAATLVAPRIAAKDVPPVPNWKMRIQAEATAYCLRLRNSGASPTKNSILEAMARWCRDNDVKTDGRIYPSANYLRTHVLGGRHWDVPN